MEGIDTLWNYGCSIPKFIFGTHLFHPSGKITANILSLLHIRRITKQTSPFQSLSKRGVASVAERNRSPAEAHSNQSAFSTLGQWEFVQFHHHCHLDMSCELGLLWGWVCCCVKTTRGSPLARKRRERRRPTQAFLFYPKMHNGFSSFLLPSFSVIDPVCKLTYPYSKEGRGRNDRRKTHIIPSCHAAWNMEKIR